MIPAVEMKQITKSFGEFVANKKIDLTILKGEVHALLGENGAGKTTLMNCLYGMFEPTDGEILVEGQSVKIPNAKVAIDLGIGMVHQHFMLIETFTVTENIILGQEIKSGPLLNMKEARKKVQALSLKYGLGVDPDARIQDISVGQQQKVEILKALYRGARILILDEPTAVLTPQEILDLGITLKNLTNEGKSIILITHKLKEIMTMADRVTVIRWGERVATLEVSGLNERDLADKMVGRKVQLVVEKASSVPGSEILQIKDLVALDQRGLKALKGLSFQVRRGEIYGIAGVDGNGQSELAAAITGLIKCESGEILLNGKGIQNLSPREVFDSGLSFIPSDRQKEGLVLDYSLGQNMILKAFRKKDFSEKGFLKFPAIKSWAQGLLEKFDVRPANEGAAARSLSGGNQQKVIIAREVAGKPEVILAVQPTRGLDVGAIEYVHRALIAQRDAGRAVLLISFELDEILNLADRIGVLYEGTLIQELERKNADEKILGFAMAGGKIGP